MVSIPGRSLFHPGAPLPAKVTGNYYFPDRALARTTQTDVTTTATRLYYWPHFISDTQAFAGAACWNSGAGDNGEKCRIGIYSHTSAGPTTLLKDFGEITFTGAAAERLLTSSVTVAGPQWVWLCIHHDSATAMYGMGLYAAVTAAGYQYGNAPSDFSADFGLVAPAAPPNFNNVGVPYVDTAYGALASTAVAPTAYTNFMPTLALKV